MRLFPGRHAADTTPVVAIGGNNRVEVNGGYTPEVVVVVAREPVRLIFHRHDESPCSEEVIFPGQAVRVTLPEGEDVAVDLPPSEPGEYDFHCGMGMLHGRLVVR